MVRGQGEHAVVDLASPACGATFTYGFFHTDDHGGVS
jgi:hypothetical protein